MNWIRSNIICRKWK